MWLISSMKSSNFYAWRAQFGLHFNHPSNISIKSHMTYIINILSPLVTSYLLLHFHPLHRRRLFACISVYRPPISLGYNTVYLAPNFPIHNLRHTRKMLQEKAFLPFGVYFFFELWKKRFDVRISKWRINNGENCYDGIYCMTSE